MEKNRISETSGKFVDPVADQDQKMVLIGSDMTASGGTYTKNKVTIEPKQDDLDFLVSTLEEGKSSLDDTAESCSAAKQEELKGGTRKKSLKKRRKTKRKGAGPKSDPSKKRKNKSVSIPEYPISSIRYISNTNQGRVYPADELQAHYDLWDLKIEQKRPISDSDSPVTKGLKKARINKELNRIPPPSPEDSPIITEEDWDEVKKILNEESPEKPQGNIIYSLNDINAAQSFLEAERERRGKASKRAMKIFREAKKGGRKSLKKSKRKGGMHLLRKRQEIDNRKTQKTYSSNTSTLLAEEKRIREEQRRKQEERLAEERKRREQLHVPIPIRRSPTIEQLSRLNDQTILERITKAEQRTKEAQERLKIANKKREEIQEKIKSLKGGRRKSLKKRRKTKRI